MINRLLDPFFKAIFRQIPADLYKDFYRNRLSSNLLKCIFIGRLCMAFFVMLMMLNVLRWQTGELDAKPIYYGLMIGHIMIGVAAIPHFFILRHRNAIKERNFPTKQGERLLFTTLAFVILATIIILLFAIYERNSLAVYGVLLLLLNFVVNPGPKPIFWINIMLYFIVLFGGFYIAGKTGSDSVVFFLEVTAFAFPVFAGSVFQYNQRIRAFLYEKELENKNKIIEDSLTERFERQIAEIEMSALRAQMNPHFLFNALNSIKLYVVSNDSKTASLYLTKFSKLIRLILNNSKEKMVSLEKELQALELYIQMEQFRFNFIFNYEIEVDRDVSQDFTEIPPMILQPYVENAIWHGLMHKHDGKGELCIKIDKKNNDLRFIIEDNGIGREKSMTLKSNTRTKHKSVGMQITADRLAIANKLYGTEGRVEVIDKKDENGLANGTRVVFTLPYED